MFRNNDGPQNKNRILPDACMRNLLSLTAHVFAVFPFDLKISHELQKVKN